MEFTDHELSIMSSALIELMEVAQKAKCVAYGKLYDELDDYIKELVRLNTKICNYMEG